MKASSWSGQMPRIMGKALIILVVFAFILAAYPQPAQAACSFKYTVQSGDSLYGIAATYQVKFEDLVELNKLKEPYIIYVGQVLCMPPGAVKPATTPVVGATTSTDKKEPIISGIHMGNILWVGVTNFPKERIYYVNVYPETKNYWSYTPYKAGQLKTDKNGKFGSWFHTPTMEEEWKITVCLKDVITDIVIGCVPATFYDIYLYK